MPPNTCVARRGSVHRRFGRVELGHRCRLSDRAALILQPRRLVGQVVRILDLHRQIGQLERQPLESADRSTERVTLLRVLDRGFQARPRRAERQCRDRDTAVIEDREEVAEPLARRTEQVLRRDPAVDERDPVRVARVPAELVVGRLDDHPRSPGRHDKRRDAIVGTGRRRDDRSDVGAAVGDERLRPVQHPLVTVEHGTGSSRTGIGPSVGFGEPERPERSTGDQVGQPLVALVLGAEPEDRVGAETDAGRQGDAHRLIDATEFLDGDAERGEVATAASPPFGEHDPEQSEVTHGVHHIDRKVAGAIPFGGVRCDPLLGELPHGCPQQFVVVAQLPAHRRRR